MFNLHPKQRLALESEATEILYGGAAGGGKSHLLRVYSILAALAVPGVQIFFFRKQKADLAEQQLEGMTGYRAMLAPLIKSKQVSIDPESGIKFANGSNITFAYMKKMSDFENFQGKEFNILLVEELTQFPYEFYQRMRSRVRAPKELFKNFYKKKAHVIAVSNPLGIGYNWVGNSFVWGHEPMEIWKAPLEEGGMTRQFIPSRLKDNPSIDYDDYAGVLHGMGKPEEVRAMLDGEWSVATGGFFEDFDLGKHVIEPFIIPMHWKKFRSMDSGFREPFSVGWWAIVPDNTQIGQLNFDAGTIIRYREWYGADKDAEGRIRPNVGLKLTSEEIGASIALMEAADANIDSNLCVLDPSAFNEAGTISVAERIRRGSGGKVAFRKAVNRRNSKDGIMGGWDILRNRLRGAERPTIYCFSTCSEMIRTFPGLIYKEGTDELASGQEDHVADEVRYACMSVEQTSYMIAQKGTLDRVKTTKKPGDLKDFFSSLADYKPKKTKNTGKIL
jgi:hypothetical protein